MCYKGHVRRKKKKKKNESGIRPENLDNNHKPLQAIVGAEPGVNMQKGCEKKGIMDENSNGVMQGDARLFV